MIIDRNMEQVKDVIKYHIKLHGLNNVVEYALVDDIQRKTRHLNYARAVIEDIVHKMLKDDALKQLLEEMN